MTKSRHSQGAEKTHTHGSTSPDTHQVDGASNDLPPAPGPNATHEEWRAWAEAMNKAGKLG